MTNTRSKTIRPKQMLVLDHWFADNCGNKSAAMKKAGYSEKTALHRAHAVFDHPHVVAEIEKRQAELRSNNELTLQWVIDRLKDIASTPERLAKYIIVTDDGKLDWDFTNASLADLTLLNDIAVECYLEGRGEGARGIKRFRIGRADQKGALDSLARILGAFNDSVTIKGELTMVERLHAGRARVKREHLEHLK